MSTMQTIGKSLPHIVGVWEGLPNEEDSFIEI